MAAEAKDLYIYVTTDSQFKPSDYSYAADWEVRDTEPVGDQVYVRWKGKVLVTPPQDFIRVLVLDEHVISWHIK